MSKGKHYFEQQIKHRDDQIYILKSQVKDLKYSIQIARLQAHRNEMESQEWARKYRAEIYQQKKMEK